MGGFCNTYIVISMPLKHSRNCYHSYLALNISLLFSVCALVRVGDVQEEVLFVVLLIECSHGGRGGRECVVDEEEECVLRPEADPLPDEEVELSDRQVRGDQVLLLVQVAQPRLRGLLHDDRNPVGVLPPDFLALGPPLLEGVLLLVGPLHPGHLGLLQVLLQWGIRSTSVRLILWDNGR